MVNLLMRFFEINSGTIKIDGVPISDMSHENVHKLFSMVLQDTWLFEGTVRENLVYNMEGITDEQLEKGARQVKSAYDDYQPLKYLQTQFMDKHEQLAPDVYRVTYSGGDSMIFNYAETDYDYDGHVVPAHDYILVKA